jgi:hypothetical protein
MMTGQRLRASGVSDLLRLLNSQICVEISTPLLQEHTVCDFFSSALCNRDEKDVLYCLFVITILDMLRLEEKDRPKSA